MVSVLRSLSPDLAVDLVPREIVARSITSCLPTNLELSDFVLPRRLSRRTTGWRLDGCSTCSEHVSSELFELRQTEYGMESLAVDNGRIVFL